VESLTPAPLDPVWAHGYEHTLPNDFDRSMQDRFKAVHAGRSGAFLGRSPWINHDLKSCPVDGMVTMTANMGVNFHRVNYCYHGMDDAAVDAIDIAARPDVAFIAGASQKAVALQRECKYHNLFLHTDPPTMPVHLQGLMNTTYPRPNDCLISGHRAVFFLHYMGCSPIYLLGVDYLPRGDVYYGDSGETGGGLALAVSENKLWLLRMKEIVAALRVKGVPVAWPGESGRA